MTYSDIKQQLFDGNTDNFYVFAGDEIEVQRAYINKIAESKKQVIRRIDTFADVFKSGGMGLLEQSFCYVCRDDLDFYKNEKAWEKVESALKDNTLIYLITKLDKKVKFYKRWESRIVIFDPMTEQVLTKHIKQQINLSTENCKELIRVCQSNYGRILTEIDKVRCYAEIYNEDINQAFQQLLKDGTIYQPPEDAIFEWVNAVLAGKPRLAFKLYQECIDIGEPSLRLLLVLYQGVKRLLQVQSCESKDIAENTGLTQWEINLVKDCIGVYRTGELVNALRNIKALETDIKMGRVDEEFTVPYAMISLIGE